MIDLRKKTNAGSTRFFYLLFDVAYSYLCDIAINLYDPDMEFISIKTGDRILDGLDRNKKAFLLVEALSNLMFEKPLNSLHESSLNSLMCLLEDYIGNECFHSDNGNHYRRLTWNAWISTGRKERYIQAVEDDENSLSEDEIEFFRLKWEFDDSSFWTEFVLDDLRGELEIDDLDLFIASDFPVMIEGGSELKKTLGIPEDYIQIGVSPISDDEVERVLISFTKLARRVLPNRRKYKKPKYHFLHQS